MPQTLPPPRRTLSDVFGSTSRTIITALAVVTVVVVSDATSSSARSSLPLQGSVGRHYDVEAAQREFYNARYEFAARMTLEACSAGHSALPACELRTAALLFQMRALLPIDGDKDRAWKQCAACPDLLSAFRLALAEGQTVARARLLERPTDDETLFLLGKLDLNYVWLQLGTLGRKTGWDEYWEARRSLDAVLKRDPGNVRARVARAWIDYIVDTRMPWGTSWLLGGGNKKRAFVVMREAASADADFYTEVEADFALWDLHVRERKLTEAVEIARGLAQHFPENRDLARFLETHDSRARP
jgi:hypothetical protein